MPIPIPPSGETPPPASPPVVRKGPSAARAAVEALQPLPAPAAPPQAHLQPIDRRALSPGALAARPASPAASGAAAAADRDSGLRQHQRQALLSAQHELAGRVHADRGTPHRSRRIDEYARAAGMPPGDNWCGYFTAFNLAQAGFREPNRIASMDKARHFFLYRTLRESEADVRAAHQAHGSTRQFFMFPESSTQTYLSRHADLYPHVDAAASTFSYDRLPIRPGDVILFERPPAPGRHPTHVAMVESYDPATGRLTTVEGNVGDRVRHKTYDLTDPRVRANIAGFGRPAAEDFAP